MSDTVKIKNKRTGEIKEVSRDSMGDYGIKGGLDVDAILQMGRPEENKKGVMEKVQEFFTGRTQSAVELMTGANSLKTNTDKTSKQNTELQQRSRDLIDQAKAESDPIKKRELIEQSRITDRVMGENSTRLGMEIDSYIDEGSVTERDIERHGEIRKEKGEKAARMDFARRKGYSAAAELAVLALPGTKEMRAIATAVKGGSTLAKMGAAAKIGASTGAIYGATDPNTETFKQRVIDGAVHGVIGGTIAAVLAGSMDQIGKGAKKLKSALWDDLLSQKQKGAEKEFYNKVVNNKRTVAERATDMNIKTNSYSDMLKQGVDGEAATEAQIKKAMAEQGIKGKQVFLDNMYDALEEQAKIFDQRPGDEKLAKVIREFSEATRKKYGNSLKLETAMSLKRSLDAVTADMNITERSAVKRQAQDMAADSIRAVIRDGFPDDLARMLDTQQVYITMKQQAIMQGGKNIAKGFIPNSLYDLRRRILENPAIIGRVQQILPTGLESAAVPGAAGATRAVNPIISSLLGRDGK